MPSPHSKINGSKIKEVDRKGYLGLTLDEKSKWDKQLHAMCKKISSAISGNKLARFLPLDALKKLYNSLVDSWLRYCCTLWGNCGEMLKNKLQRMQYRAARVVCKTAPETDDEVALENLSRLNVQQLIVYNIALLIWKSKNGLASTYVFDMSGPVKSVHNCDTRKAEFDFYPAKKNLTAGTRSFSHTGRQIWNKLLKDAQAASSLKDFKTVNFLLSVSWEFYMQTITYGNPLTTGAGLLMFMGKTPAQSIS